MNNRVLLSVSAVSVLALALATAVIVVASAARLNLSAVVFAALLILFAFGSLTGAAAWLLGLMRTARDRHWEWFIEILVLGPLGALIFSVAAVRGNLAASGSCAAIFQ